MYKKEKIKRLLRKISVVSVLFILLLMAVLDTFGILTYERIAVFLKLRDSAFSSAEVSVHFIDVGQGDSTLIISGENTALIDAGEKEYGDKVASYLKSQGIEQIDYIIATHPHSDHIGGIENVIENFSTGGIIVPHLTETASDDLYLYRCLAESAAKNKVPLIEAFSGMELSLDCSVLRIIAPLGEYENINSCSVVSELVHGENIFLFTGDAEAESEADMIRGGVLEDVDVLKAGHHGSSTSTCSEFLEIIKPEFTVISCGAGNSYNHPSESVMRSLDSLGVQIFRTDLQGNIIAESDGEKISFNFS